MMDENKLKTKLVLRPPDQDQADDSSQDKPNDEVIGQTLTDALKAVAELHRLRPDMNLSSLKPAVDALASGSGNPAVRDGGGANATGAEQVSDQPEAPARIGPNPRLHRGWSATPICFYHRNRLRVC